MRNRKSTPNRAKLDDVVAAARREKEDREKGYREQALKMYPWICGRCGREFNLKNLTELTVHHRNHNHDDNPSDGSNWELLCLYCHDDEHSRYLNADVYGKDGAGAGGGAGSHKAFAGLEALLKKDK
jgi:5-methylcytosine-specific restriction endonuclease McrA